MTTVSMTQYTHLSEAERNEIYLLLQLGTKQKDIAKTLRRNEGTISREILRNSSVFPKANNALKDKVKEDYRYLPDSAQRKYLGRRKTCGWRPPLKNLQSMDFVIAHLKRGWSPDIIAGSMRKDFPDDPSMRISHECIYQFIYSKKGEELKLKQHLVRSHKRRRKKTGRSVRKTSKIPNRTDISERPEHVLTREEFGHFEGDSILSVRSTKSAFRTEVERKSRKVFAKKVGRKTALLTREATIAIYQGFPKGVIKSITWDNGSEHTKHGEISEELGIPIYFARPYHSWERGTNEHANGMIRRFFPKGTNFDNISDIQLQNVVDYLNNRPRKILNYKTPNQVFDACLAEYLSLSTLS